MKAKDNYNNRIMQRIIIYSSDNFFKKIGSYKKRRKIS